MGRLEIKGHQSRPQSLFTENAMPRANTITVKSNGGTDLYHVTTDGNKQVYRRGHDEGEVGWIRFDNGSSGRGQTWVMRTGKMYYEVRPDILIAECRRACSNPSAWEV